MDLKEMKALSWDLSAQIEILTMRRTELNQAIAQELQKEAGGKEKQEGATKKQDGQAPATDTGSKKS